MINIPKKELYRPDEAAAYFCVSRPTIYRWMSTGVLKSEKIGGVRRIKAAELKKSRKFDE